MDFSKRLSISYYKNIAILNEEHNIYIVQHQESKKIFVKKKLHIFNTSIYHYLQNNPIDGIPKIVELYEEDSSLTVIEEYISGETLREKIDRRCLGERDITYYINSLCSILIKLHSLSPPIIHRDIKPSNIIVTPYNQVFLLDFNAAKYFTDAKSPDTVLIGTEGYAAPEQYGFGSSTQQTDIYAVGVLFKELISSLSTPTNKFNHLIAKCTQLKPSDRFLSVAELHKKLRLESPDNGTHQQINSWRFFIPPGFRTHTPWRMLVASLGYLMIFWLSLSLTIPNINTLQLWLERIYCLLMFLSITFVGTNYLDIQNAIPLCQHKNRIIHYFGIVILDVILISILMTSMLIFESFL